MLTTELFYICMEKVRLKKRYKFRLILDETSSYGVLGSKTCRGTTEHFGVPASEIDMIIGSLAGPLCAGGGFCAGSLEIVEHQRISAAAYTFSAALPGMLATMATEVIGIISGDGDGNEDEAMDRASNEEASGLVRELRSRIGVMRRGLSEVVEMAMPSPDDVGVDGESQKLMCCTSASENPVLIITLQPELVRTRGWSVDDEERVLQDIVDEVCIDIALY